ncbi:hypothetical protein HDE_03932 [Halotydeus destructor]|nr:hypothetical protein HDE_03932 [Halotydeus destructor]
MESSREASSSDLNKDSSLSPGWTEVFVDHSDDVIFKSSLESSLELLPKSIIKSKKLGRLSFLNYSSDSPFMRNVNEASSNSIDSTESLELLHAILNPLKTPRRILDNTKHALDVNKQAFNSPFDLMSDALVAEEKEVLPSISDRNEMTPQLLVNVSACISDEKSPALASPVDLMSTTFSNYEEAEKPEMNQVEQRTPERLLDITVFVPDTKKQALNSQLDLMSDTYLTEETDVQTDMNRTNLMEFTTFINDAV